MRALVSLILGTVLAGSMVAAPIAYKRWHDHEFRGFHVVEDGVLYRSGQLSVPRLQQVSHTYGIRTIVSLRDADKPVDKDEEVWAKAMGIKFVRLAPLSWWPDADGKVPADENVQIFRDIMADPANHPVLVHCFAGIHRTGTMCAVYRMDFQGWTNEQAMNEMRLMGYTILDEHDDVRGYMTRYRPPTRQPRP